MKKSFSMPEMEIKEFMAENIVTTSSIEGTKLETDADISGYKTEDYDYSKFETVAGWVW